MQITRSMIRYRQPDNGAGTSGSGGSGNGSGSGGNAGGAGSGGGAGAGEGGTGGSGGGSGQPGGQGGSGDGDALKRALDAERTARETAERELRDARKRLQDIDDASKSELQKATERAEAAERALTARETKVRELVGKEAVLTEAIAASAKRPAAIYQLVKDQLQFDEKTGAVTNAKAVLDQARKDVPELFGISGNGNAGSGGGDGASGTDMNALIRQASGRGGN